VVGRRDTKGAPPDGGAARDEEEVCGWLSQIAKIRPIRLYPDFNFSLFFLDLEPLPYTTDKPFPNQKSSELP
jgi:hypothetical protein